ASEAQCFPVPQSCDFRTAAMAEPLAVALHAVRRAGLLVGKSVLVTGVGPIGSLCVLAARRAGAARIVVTDVADGALKRAASSLCPTCAWWSVSPSATSITACPCWT
ncbi:MAG TPA: hypothetical protein PLO53_05615, partial [Candidatus Hydrogenedentes bacterium]|nr:hypothetical protein [Candidatus Hydrogenedentota bacterium]